MSWLCSDTLKTNIILIVIFDVIGYYKQRGSSRNLSQNSVYTQFQFFISLPVSAEAHHTFELLMKPGASSHGLVLKCKSWQPESPRETCEAVCHKLQICKQTGSNVGHALEESHYLEAVGLRWALFHLGRDSIWGTLFCLCHMVSVKIWLFFFLIFIQNLLTIKFTGKYPSD